MPSLASVMSNISGQGTHYSSGVKLYPPPHPVSPLIKQTLSKSSSLDFSEAQRKAITQLKKEIDILIIAMQQFERNAPPWLLLNTTLDKANEELDAVQQDMEMCSGPGKQGDTKDPPVNATSTVNTIVATEDRGAPEHDNINGAVQSKSPETPPIEVKITTA